MTTKNAFDTTVSALRKVGFSSDKILEILSALLGPTQNFAEKVDEVNVPKEEKKVLTDEEKAQKLRKLFRELGILCNLKGYQYLITGVILYEKDPLQAVTKEIYPVVASTYGTTASKVERSMRHAINSACNCVNNECMNNLFGNTIQSKRRMPTNTEFLATCAEWLKN